MARIHGLQHVNALFAAHLTHHDTIGTHTQRVCHQLPDAHLAFALYRLRASLQAHYMGMTRKFKLRRILDGHDALTQINFAGKGVEQRGLTRSRAAGNRQILPQRNRARKQLRIPRRQRAQFHQLAQRGDPVRKLPNREHRPVNCNGRNHCIHAIPAWEASVHDRTPLIDTATQWRDNPVDDHANLFIVCKYVVHRIELSRAFEKDRIAPVDHDLAHAVII